MMLVCVRGGEKDMGVLMKNAAVVIVGMVMDIKSGIHHMR
jgi:hypothetical protein